MSDIKEMNKYYPPDFDPQAFHRNKHLLRRKSKKRKIGADGAAGSSRRMELRMLWPFSIVCGKCEDVIPVGTKFNSKVEKVKGETYLGVTIWRIIGRCLECRNEIVLKTDPEHTDYVVESGGKRLFDMALAAKELEEARTEFKQQQEDLDQMEQLQMKALNTAEEVKDLEALEELRRINKIFMSQTDELNEDILKTLYADDDERQTAAALVEFSKQQDRLQLEDEYDEIDPDGSNEEAPQAPLAHGAKSTKTGKLAHKAPVVCVKQKSGLGVPSLAQCYSSSSSDDEILAD